jgi:predicted  nucleic acid-binding Zn-ribbon protein
MAVKDILAELKDKAVADLASANTEVDTLRGLESAIADENKAAHDQGFQDGVAQATNPGDKIYTQADMDAKVNPLNEQISGLKDQLVDSETARTGMQGQIDDLTKKLNDVNTDVEANKELGRAEVRGELQPKIDDLTAHVDALQADDDAKTALIAKIEALLVPAPQPQPEPTAGQ